MRRLSITLTILLVLCGWTHLADSQISVTHTVISPGRPATGFHSPGNRGGFGHSTYSQPPIHSPMHSSGHSPMHSSGHIPMHNLMHRPVPFVGPIAHRRYGRSTRQVRRRHSLQKRGLTVAQGVVLGAVGGALVTKKLIKGAKKLAAVVRPSHHHHHHGHLLGKRHVRSTEWFQQLAQSYEPTFGQVRQQVQQVMRVGLATMQQSLPQPSEQIRMQLSRFPAAFSAATGIRLPPYESDSESNAASSVESLDAGLDSPLSNVPNQPNRIEAVNHILNNHSPVQPISWPPAPSVHRTPVNTSNMINPAADVLKAAWDAAETINSTNNEPIEVSQSPPIIGQPYRVINSESSNEPNTAEVPSNELAETSESDLAPSNVGFESVDSDAQPVAYEVDSSMAPTSSDVDAAQPIDTDTAVSSDNVSEYPNESEVNAESG